MNHNKYPLSADLDYYKLTMGQAIHEYHPDDIVTFTFKNRDKVNKLSEYVPVDELQNRLEEIRAVGFTGEEIAYYAGLMASDDGARFSEDYLDALADLELPEVNVNINPETNDLDINSTGKWLNVTFWETVIMSEINQIHYKNMAAERGLSLDDLYAEGNQRLTDKIEKLRAHPGIKFADFGTRRRFSREWHEHVVNRLANELPEQFIGTSNPWFAYEYNLAPIGTFAHEMPMVYAGLAGARGDNPLNGHNEMLQNWDEVYDGDLSTALTDTFTSEFFWADFTPEQAEKWSGLRHDSGDPIEFGERAIEFYTQNNIDPSTKTIVFSDGLDIDKIVELYEYFNGRINVVFGWGTSLMNDLGLKANNMVMKATHVNGEPTVKLSDNEGKHTGPEDYVQNYASLAKEAVRRAGLVLAA